MTSETSDIMRDMRDRLREAIDVELSGAEMKRLQKQAQDISDEIATTVEWYIKENIASWLADHVSATASAVIEAILAGNESEARRRLSLKPEVGYDGRDGAPWFATTSSLHETGPVELRRKIVEAHRDLIADERIADLEAQLKALAERYCALEHVEAPRLRNELVSAQHELEQWRSADRRLREGAAP